MGVLDKKVLKVLFLMLIAPGCASQSRLNKVNLYPCDSLMQNWPDGYYDMGNRRVVKQDDRCIEAVRKPIIKKTYWQSKDSAWVEYDTSEVWR